MLVNTQELGGDGSSVSCPALFVPVIWSVTVMSCNVRSLVFDGPFSSDLAFSVFHERCLRKIIKVTYKDYITNEEILLWVNSRKLSVVSDIVTERRFRMAGHKLRLPDQRAAKVAMSWTPADGTGRPKKTWCRTFQQDLQMVDCKWEEVEYVATGRSKWRHADVRCAQRRGQN